MPKKTPPVSSKTAEDRPIKRQPVREEPRDEFVNPAEEVPLNSNQNFMALLEKEMAKENSRQPQMAKGPASKKQMSNFD